MKLPTLESDLESGDGVSVGSTVPASSEAGQSLEDYIVYRRAVPEDLNFIRKNGLKITYDWYRRTKRATHSKAFYNSRDQWLTRLFQFCPVVVATDKQDPGFIYGFAAGWAYDDGSAMVHFLYVRPEFRRRGLAKKLLATMGYNWGAPMVATAWSHFLKSYCPPFIELDEDQFFEVSYASKP